MPFKRIHVCSKKEPGANGFVGLQLGKDHKDVPA
jgi:hypothetical protein